MPTTHDPAILVLHSADSVAVACRPLAVGEIVEARGRSVVVREGVPAGHKLALSAIGSGEAVRKYGQTIGFARAEIAAGEHVHSHNLAFSAFDRDLAPGGERRGTVVRPEAERRTFDGYVRDDGRVATRNYVGVLTSVNCSATVARRIAEECNRPEFLAQFPNTDGVVALTHGLGCAMRSEGEGFDLLTRTIRGFAEHPNFAGVLLLGLGCEVNQVDALSEDWAATLGKPYHVTTIQAEGGARATLRLGVERVEELLSQANDARREPVPVSELVLATQCGGSDGYSGVTANPALGAAADLLVEHGGTAVLGETPEIYGAEHLLTRRAAPEVAQRLAERIEWWERYAAANGGSMDNNPSPGNKLGGLTTILEKSLGAVAKAGSSDLMDVVGYAEPIRSRGLVFMDTPGYDPVSSTGLIAGGCNILCFTTGRGSVYGSKPVPSLKLAASSTLYARMPEDMDINCGVIVDGSASVEEVGNEIFDLIIATASGRRTRGEEFGFGEDEFQPWHVGAVM
jgi:altronate hydrolase